MIVVKFGGTSVADAAAVERAASIVAGREARRPVVVVSALAGTTSDLLGVAEMASRGHLIGALGTVQALRDRHLHECGLLLGGGSLCDDISGELSATLDELAHLAEALSVLGHLTPRSLDAVAAMGEQMSSLLVTAAFVQRGIRAVHVDARDVMITDDCYTRAEPRVDAIATRARERVAPLIREHSVPVLGGFVGATMSGITTTLGRGGSDYSASLLGAALGAEAIEIWTDVDGMLTADPRVVSGSRLIPEIRFDEASELASFGAKVLHPSTITPAVRLGIPVFVYNSRHPHGAGTRITFDAPRRTVSAIAGRAGITVLKVRAPKMLLAPGFLRSVFEVFEQNATSVDVVATSEVSVSVTIDDDARLEELVVRLRVLGDVAVERDRGVVAVVGAGIGDRAGSIGRAMSALGDLTVHMASLSATGINLTVVVDGDCVPHAINRLHDEFFGAARAR